MSKKGGPKEGWTVPGCSLSLFLIQIGTKTIWKREIDVDFNTGLACTETPIEEEKNLTPSLFSDTYVVTCEVAGKKGLTITSLQAYLELWCHNEIELGLLTLTFLIQLCHKNLWKSMIDVDICVGLPWREYACREEKISFPPFFSDTYVVTCVNCKKGKIDHYITRGLSWIRMLQCHNEGFSLSLFSYSYVARIYGRYDWC